MEELIQVLCHHASCYPAMEPVDAVKLIYQNEFGGGHLVANEDTFRQWLWREYESVPKDAAAVKYEPIGNGIVRVYLSALSESEVEPAFIRATCPVSWTSWPFCGCRRRRACFRSTWRRWMPS